MRFEIRKSDPSPHVHTRTWCAIVDLCEGMKRDRDGAVVAFE